VRHFLEESPRSREQVKQRRQGRITIPELPLIQERFVAEGAGHVREMVEHRDNSWERLS
jgi:hypothetical protein